MSDKDINVSFTANAEGLKSGASQSAAAVESAINRMNAAFDKMAAQTRNDTAQMREQMQQVSVSTNNLASSMESMVGGVKGLLGGLSVLAIVKEFVTLADQMALTQARLKNTTTTAAEFAEVQKSVYEIAQRNNIGLQEASQLYTKLSDPVKRLGGGVVETTAIVDAFAMSLRVGGANTQEASAATLQFAQAMASGKLQGDEFRSLAEASPRFMKAIAEGANLPIEQLKKMGSEGKLSAELVGNALMASAEKLRAESATLPDTVGGAFQRVKNDILLAVEQLDKAGGTTNALAQVFGFVADMVREFTDGMRDLNGELQSNAKDAEDLKTLMRAIGYVFETVIVVGANVTYVFKGIATEVVTLIQQLEALANFDFKKAFKLGEGARAQADIARKEIDALTDKMIGMTDRVMDKRNNKESGNAGDSAKAEPKKLKSTANPEGDLDKLELWKMQLQRKIESEKGFFDTSVSMEIAFWKSKLAEVGKGSAEELKTRASIEKELYSLRKTAATQDRALNEEAISTAQRVSLNEIAIERDKLAQQKSTRQLSLEESLSLELDLANRELEVRRSAIEDKAKLYAGDKVAKEKILNELKTLEQDHVRQLFKINQDYQQNALADKIATMRIELEQYRNNMDERLRIAKQIQAEVNKVYGQESREAQAAAQEVGRIERQKAEQIKSINQMIANSKTETQLAIIDGAASQARFEREMNQMTRLQLLEQEQQFEQQRYNIKMQALKEREAMLEKDPDHNIEEAARVKEQMLELERTYSLKQSEMRRDQVKESNRDYLNMFSNMQNSMAGVFGQMMRGMLTFKDFMREMLKAILGAFIDMIAQMIARWIMSQVMQKYMSKLTAGSQIAANASVAASGAMASVAAIPFYGWTMAPAVGATTFATAMGYQAGLAAEQGFDVPAGMNPVTQLHQKEMVLPASQADVIRNMADNGGGNAPVTVNISAVDSKSVRDLFMREGSSLTAALRSQQRNLGFSR
jgi:tape measure domain-containing protein